MRLITTWALHAVPDVLWPQLLTDPAILRLRHHQGLTHGRADPEFTLGDVTIFDLALRNQQQNPVPVAQCEYIQIADDHPDYLTITALL